VTPGKERENPEHIGSLLQRVLEDLETKYQEKHGGRSSDLSGKTLTFPGPASLSGRENQSGHFQG
jgi:hypothetical protein